MQKQQYETLKKLDIENLINLVRNNPTNDILCKDVVEIIEDKMWERYQDGIQAESYSQAM